MSLILKLYKKELKFLKENAKSRYGISSETFDSIITDLLILTKQKKKNSNVKINKYIYLFSNIYFEIIGTEYFPDFPVDNIIMKKLEREVTAKGRTLSDFFSFAFRKYKYRIMKSGIRALPTILKYYLNA